MYFCETGGETAQDFEDLAVFTSQMSALGVAVGVHSRSVPEDLNRNIQFDLAPRLVDGPLSDTHSVLLVAAHRVDGKKLVRLRHLVGGTQRQCLAFGRFDSEQEIIGTRAKLSYVFGQDPKLFNLADAPLSRSESSPDCPVFGLTRHSLPEGQPRVLLVAPDLRDRTSASALITLALSRRFHTSVLTDGRSKQDWRTAYGTDIDIYHYGEILPAHLMEGVDICVSFAQPRSNYRLRCLFANLAQSGAALVDATQGHAIARENDAFIRGPIDISGMAAFLGSEVLPNLAAIGRQAKLAKATARGNARRILKFLDAVPNGERVSKRMDETVAGRGRVVLMPTNGVGLGHAQRCALIAAELDKDMGKAIFAAFPSCLKLAKSYGFDAMPLIGRSGFHAQTHENDLTNYLRLRALADEARILVFDGGYVFDSVFRSIVENRLRGVWIRRGLWQSGQDNSIALDREKVFGRVIVPGEGFEELNAAYSFGDHLHVVGPVAQRLEMGAVEKGDLRARLAERFGRPFERLVVSLLGAGVAADRGGQIQTLCGMMERRTDVLHLVVVWPTAALRPSWFDWKNSQVVRSHHAGVLAAAADLCVSAAGYNSFHEMLYTATPAIFIPQTGSFMDDQRARAVAARERGLAGMVDPHELMTLEREVSRFLDGGAAEDVRKRLKQAELPERGNAAAARVIEEYANGPQALERDPVTDISSRRR